MSIALATPVLPRVLILLKIEFVDPNIVLVDRPPALTEFLYFASAPGAAESTRDVTRLPSWRGADGGGVRLADRGLGLPAKP